MKALTLVLVFSIALAHIVALPSNDGESGCGYPGVGDGVCDDDNNIQACGWDGGDCCRNDVDTSFCSACACLDPDVTTTTTTTAA